VSLSDSTMLQEHGISQEAPEQSRGEPGSSIENVIDLLDDIMSVNSNHSKKASTTLHQGPLAILPKEKQLNDFIEKLLELTMCPINMTIFKDPVVTMNGNLFESDKLYKWLNDNNGICPLTRSSFITRKYSRLSYNETTGRYYEIP